MRTCRQAVNQILKETDAAVAPCQHQNPRVEPAGLLERNLGPQYVQVFGCGHAFKQRRAYLPTISDYTVGVSVLADGGRKGDEAELPRPSVELVDCLTSSFGIYVENFAASLPTVAGCPAKHHPAEAVTSEPSSSERGGSHDHFRRPDRVLTSLQFGAEPINSCHRESS